MAGVVPTNSAGDEAAAQAAAACLKAGKKSSTCWVATPGHEPRLVWASWLAGGICLMTGGGEQELPGLAGAERVTVTMHSPGPNQTAGASSLIVAAAPEVVAPTDALWAEVAGSLADRRLNGGATPAELLERWRTASTLVRLSVVAD